MDTFDKTRDNIKVKDLGERDRKDLFHKFKEAGGEVVADRKARRKIMIDREKQLQYLEKIKDRNKKYKRKYAKHIEKNAAKSSSKDILKAKAFVKNKEKRSFLGSFIDRFTIKSRLYFLRVSKFSAYKILPKFFDKFDVEYKTALIEIQLLYLDLFKKKPAIGEKIITSLDKMNPLYFELIEMSADIYDRTLTGELLDKYLSFPDDVHKILDYRKPVTTYFKKLYTVHFYQDTIFTAFERAINLQMQFERDKASEYAAKRKKIRNSLNSVFNKLFIRLYWLFCFYQKQIIPLSATSVINEMLNIKPEQKPGNRIAQAPSTLNADLTHTEPKTNKAEEEESRNEVAEEKPAEKETPQEILKKKQKDKTPQSVKRGLTMMSQLNMENLRKEFIKDDLIRNISDTDKLLVIYLLFHEFDKEYSCILTTHQIKYKNFYTKAGKIDYHQRLSDLYDKMRDCTDALEQYFNSVNLYEKARAERPLSNEQYLKYAKKLSELEESKTKSGRVVRHIINTFMSKVSEHLVFLLKNMDTPKQIVINPQHLLEFDESIEGEKKLHNKKVFQAITLVNDYVSALCHRISGSEDLSSDKDATQNKYEHVSQDDEEGTDQNGQPELDLTGQSSEAGTEIDSNSILGELNDLV
jgi:hypothetical protein